MRHLIIGLILSVMALQNIEGQSYTEIDRDKLLEIVGRSNDTTYVVNFWATWCSPCVKEIGYFEELSRESQGKKLEIILISLDFPNRAEKQLLPFLKEKEITARVLLMTDMDYNGWIDKVDNSWSGAIPATLIFNSRKRIFLEQELSREELNNYVNQILN